MNASVFHFLLNNFKTRFVHLWDDDGSNIVLRVPCECIPLIRFIARLTGCKFKKL